MKRIALSSLVSLLFLSCSVSLPNNLSKKEDFSSLVTKYNFAELEKEYKSFSTKALSNAYVQRMFNKYLTTTPNSTQVIRQLEFARYLKSKSDTSYFDSLRTIIANENSLYTKITDFTEVSEKMTTESGTFGDFVRSISPLPGTPVANNATNISPTSFTANWDGVSAATGYKLYINDQPVLLENVTSYNVSVLTPASAYNYYVKAINNGVESQTSNTISISTPEIQLTEINSISTNGACDWEFFTINGENYIAVANFHNDANYNIPSKIYKWNNTTGKFDTTPLQSIDTNGGTDFEHFTIGSDNYIAVSNRQSSSTAYNIYSRIYKWDNTTGKFNTTTAFQSILTSGAYRWKHFTIGTEHYLAIANHRSNSSYNTPSKIYKFNTTTNQFDEFQSINTNGGGDFEHFTIGSDNYIAVSNFYNGTTYNDIPSKIYKWNTTTNQFDILTPFQSVLGNAGIDFEHFTIGSDNYLALANNRTNLSYSIPSKIYKWDTATNQFNISTAFQSINTIGALDSKHFTIGANHYLVISNDYNGSSYSLQSKIYKWNFTSGQFDEIRSFQTYGACFFKFFTIGMKHYLAVTNHIFTSHNIDSKIYRLD